MVAKSHENITTRNDILIQRTIIGISPQSNNVGESNNQISTVLMEVQLKSKAISLRRKYKKNKIPSPPKKKKKSKSEPLIISLPKQSFKA